MIGMTWNCFVVAGSVSPLILDCRSEKYLSDIISHIVIYIFHQCFAIRLFVGVASYVYSSASVMSGFTLRTFDILIVACYQSADAEWDISFIQVLDNSFSA